MESARKEAGFDMNGSAPLSPPIVELRPGRWNKVFSLLGLVGMIFPLVLALGWTTWPALQALYAVVSFPNLDARDDELRDEQRLLEIRRMVQKALLAKDLYVPVEDVVVGTQVPGTGQRFQLLMLKACGRGKLHVWIPLRLKWPLIGERIYEVCWDLSGKLR